jgi:hypothetical protein
MSKVRKLAKKASWGLNDYPAVSGLTRNRKVLRKCDEQLDGLTAQMGDVWEDFADKLMNKGPFDILKGRVKGVLDWYGQLSKPEQTV